MIPLRPGFSPVVCTINMIGRDDHHWTMMALRDGRVVARRHGNQGQRKLSRVVIKHWLHPEFRDEETLRYIAELKGFAAL